MDLSRVCSERQICEEEQTKRIIRPEHQWKDTETPRSSCCDTSAGRAEVELSGHTFPTAPTQHINFSMKRMHFAMKE